MVGTGGRIGDTTEPWTERWTGETTEEMKGRTEESVGHWTEERTGHWIEHWTEEIGNNSLPTNGATK